jgi:hypothetical protein
MNNFKFIFHFFTFFFFFLFFFFLFFLRRACQGLTFFFLSKSFPSELFSRMPALGTEKKAALALLVCSVAFFIGQFVSTAPPTGSAGFGAELMRFFFFFFFLFFLFSFFFLTFFMCCSPLPQIS